MPLGAKLQSLVEHECIDLTAANELSDEKKAAIENLLMSQINAIIEVRQTVGEIKTANFI
jgi:hypothetical protein